MKRREEKKRGEKKIISVLFWLASGFISGYALLLCGLCGLYVSVQIEFIISFFLSFFIDLFYLTYICRFA